jgi:hypothetical protein
MLELGIIAFEFWMSLTIHVFHDRYRSESAGLCGRVVVGAHPRSLKMKQFETACTVQVIT